MLVSLVGDGYNGDVEITNFSEGVFMVTKKKSLLILPIFFAASFLCVFAKKKYVSIFAHGLGGDKFQQVHYIPFFGCGMVAKDGFEWDKKIRLLNNFAAFVWSQDY